MTRHLSARINVAAAQLKVFYFDYQNDNEETFWDGTIVFFPFSVLKVISENLKMQVYPIISSN